MDSTVLALSSPEGCPEKKGSCIEVRRICNFAFFARVKWRAVNAFAFLACTVVLLYQSSEFYKRFYEYPTNIKIEKTSLSTRDSFPLPAVTVCYENISRNRFCNKNPSLCRNVKSTHRMCWRHLYYCQASTDIVRLARLGYYTDNVSPEVQRSAFELLVKGGKNTVPFMDKPKPKKLTATFVNIGGLRFAQCYTDNLHLSGSDEGRIYKKRGIQTKSAEVLFDIELKIRAPEVLFDPWIFPHAYFAIHSPFEPINPVHGGQRLRLGKNFFMRITRLEEDNLLPYPYQTDCMDYEALNKEKNMTGPRSQEICLDLCRAEQFKKCDNCDGGLRMYESIKNYCIELECRDDILENMPKITENCHARCKPDCRKLKYHYKITKFTTTDQQNRSLSIKEIFDGGIRMKIQVSIRNPDIFVFSHVPMFGSEELFSYIGGLMGCWLGISVWSFTDILEKNYRRILNFKEKLKLKREKKEAM